MFKKIVLSLLVFTLHVTLYTYVSAATLTAKITLATGPVEVRIGGAPAWKKAEKKMLLTEKDEIRTSPGAKATLVFEDGSKIKLEENTTLAISELKADTVDLAMNTGEINARVKKVKKGGKFQVGTSASVCAVRSTNFKVKANEKETEVECYRGAVGVIKSDTLEETTLSRWEKITVSREQALSSPIIMSKDEIEVVLAPIKEEFNQEVRMGMSREQVQSAAAQEIKLAEYQQGKSLIDAFGYRVRMEEYIVRPPDNLKQFKMVVLNERENRFDYFTWKATFNKDLPTDLTEVTSKIAWNGGDTQSQSDFYLKANESAASNTVDIVEWGFTGGHLAGSDNKLFFNNYYFKINNNDKITYQPKIAGTDITDAKTELNYYISGNLVGSYVTDIDLNTYVNDYNTLYEPDITISNDNKDYWKFNAWWDTNVTSTKSDSSEVWDNRLQANFGGSLYNEDYYLIDDNGKKATLEEMNKIYDLSAKKYVKSELLKWNQELVMSGGDFKGPDKKIDLVVEPKIFIDAGIIQTK